MAPRSSNQPPPSIPPTNAPKTDLDPAFKRSGLGQRKTDNPFKPPAGPSAANTSFAPSSTASQPLSNEDGLRRIASRISPSQTQMHSWKPVGGNPSPSAPYTSRNVDMPSTSQGKGKGKEREVLSSAMEVDVIPEVATKSGAETARMTKDEWLKKIWLLVAAVETRARQLNIKTELSNLKGLQDRYSVKGEQNSEGSKRLIEELDKKVAADKAAVAKLKELCFKLASGCPGDDDPEFQPPTSERGDTKHDIIATEERKNLLASLKQVQEEVHQVTTAVSETSKILTEHRNHVAAFNDQHVAHDSDGDVNMDTAQRIAGPSSSSSVPAGQAGGRSLFKEITKLKRRIELLDQGLEDARAEVEDARVTLVAKIDSLAEDQAATVSEATNQDQTPPSPQQAALSGDQLVQRVDQLSEEVAFVATIVADATEKTTGMSLKSLRDQNVELRERLGQLEQDRARRNGIIEQLARRLAQVQRPPLPAEELRNEVFERTRNALRPILEDVENKNEEAVKKAEIRLTRQLRDGLEDIGLFYNRLKNLPGDQSPRSSMTDASMH
ncbi:hypothetical protein FS837_007641 [Tulasnella sp. UAMH 9824]|nr:hypothetical protein FS837_007641 [Tulasnella sp. UAMH 9824]